MKIAKQVSADTRIWPSLPLEEWQSTYATLHMWMQIVGKVRLEFAPLINHWWEVAFYVTPRGLTTSAIPYKDESFDIEFDFIDHFLVVRTSWDRKRLMQLRPQSVAEFYDEFMNLLRALGIQVKINTLPQEVPDPIPFEKDHQHSSYDREYAHRHWRILLQVQRLLEIYRSDFIGKSSPTHFFWGSFDLAETRFSGRRAPERPGADKITREAYSHEVLSCGFWPGSGNIQEPAFYAYAWPEPERFKEGRVTPSTAFYNPPTQGFILRYSDVQSTSDPDRMILDFFRSVYTLGADLGHWDRSALERQPGPLRQVS